jgi:hypothetical protein
VPRISVHLKATVSPPWMGKECSSEPRANGGGAPGGVPDHGTYEEDGPVTREALSIPLGRDRHGEPVNKLQTGARQHEHARPGSKKRSSCAGVGRRQGEPEPRPKDARESVGLIGAMTVGNSWHLDPPEQRSVVLKPPLAGEGPGPTGLSGRVPVLV